MILFIQENQKKIYVAERRCRKVYRVQYQLHLLSIPPDDVHDTARSILLVNVLYHHYSGCEELSDKTCALQVDIYRAQKREEKKAKTKKDTRKHAVVQNT